jgi:hypothetical protein
MISKNLNKFLKKVVYSSSLGWSAATEEKIKNMTKATIRCIPLDAKRVGTCVYRESIDKECFCKSILIFFFFFSLGIALLKIVVFCIRNTEAGARLSVRTHGFIHVEQFDSTTATIFYCMQ